MREKWEIEEEIDVLTRELEQSKSNTEDIPSFMKSDTYRAVISSKLNILHRELESYVITQLA